MAKVGEDDPELRDLREVVADLKELKAAISFVRDSQGTWQVPPPQLPAHDINWNFTTFEKFINQRFVDLSMNLRERFEAQQTGLAAALSAAEKAVNAALIAAEKAVDKAERAQELRNQVANEFRQSLQDLSRLMWPIAAGEAAVAAMRREFQQAHDALTAKVEEQAKGMGERIGTLEKKNENLQGRLWALGVVFALISLGTAFLPYIIHVR